MKTFTLVLVACLVAVALARRGGHGKRGHHGPKPASCVADRPDRVRKTSEEKDAAKECIKEKYESLGLDLKAAKECLKDCPREEREDKERPDFGVTKEQHKCFKSAAKDLMKACVESTDVVFAEKSESSEESDEDDDESSEERGKGGRRGGKGGRKGGKGGHGKGGRRGGKGHHGKSLAKFVEKAEKCGQTECVNAALGDFANDVEGAEAAMKAAKEECFGARPERPEPTGQCAADLATIKAAFEGGCGLEESLGGAASDCGISDDAFAAMKAHHEERKANRGDRRGKRAVDMLEQFDL